MTRSKKYAEMGFEVTLTVAYMYGEDARLAFEWLMFLNLDQKQMTRVFNIMINKA